jgi:diaminopimelate epimerase
MMPLRFTKMHGLGNDFVVFDGISQRVQLTPAQIRYLADRHFGIGCDQVLLVEPARSPAADFRYRIFNADGGEVEQCGNGARCFARFVRDCGLTEKDRMAVETTAGDIELAIEADGAVTVDIGVPRLAPAAIPFVAAAQALSYELGLGEDSIEIGAVSMGNPHAVLRVPDVHGAAVARLGPLIEAHPRFPRRTNVGFMEVVDAGHIRLRVHERGVGETLACGTGACAAVVVGRLRGWLQPQVRVDLPGGSLGVRWDGGASPVRMTGPAVHVFDGTVELPG